MAKKDPSPTKAKKKKKAASKNSAGAAAKRPTQKVDKTQPDTAPVDEALPKGKTALDLAAEEADRLNAENSETTTKKRGRPKGGKKGKRTKKDVGGFAWFVREPVDDVGDEFDKPQTKASKLSGPFATEEAALDDISAVAPEGEVVLMRGYRIGRVKTVTKLVG